MNFQQEIINWYLVNKRDLPWRNTSDPYIIWLSEIILQQTRVAQGMPYFYKFLANFPTVQDFAAASEDQVLKLWEGLGYYSRGRNMLNTAKMVVDLHNGLFPTDYDTLIKLKGIGDYTASAISSFAVKESRAVLDGNVFRVLSRFYGIELAINSTEGKKAFAELAFKLIQGQDSSIYNQAIMEFGALQCKPKQPLCESCPLRLNCYAYTHQQVEHLPLKIKANQKKIRYFYYMLVQKADLILIKQREAGDVWQQLYDFPLIELPGEMADHREKFQKEVFNLFNEEVILTPIVQVKHVLTHQIIYVHFFALNNNLTNFNTTANFKWVSRDDLVNLPKANVIKEFVKFYLTKI